MIGRRSAIPRMSLILTILSLCALALHAKTTLLDEYDNSTRIDMHVGYTISVKLKSNITTGFSWSITSAPPCLQLLDSKHDQNNSPRIGESGFQVFTFKATNSCDSSLKMNYARPFEKDKPPAGTFWVDLAIQPWVTHELPSPK